MPSDAIKSAQRTLRVFEYFDRIQGAAGARDVAKALGAPRSSTAALLSSLVKLGYLAHDRSSRKYMPTLRLAELGAWLQRGLPDGERERLVPVLRALKAKVDETVVLGTVQGLNAQYLHVELADRPVMYFVRAGALRPLCRSAVGWTLLSGLPDDEILRIIERHNSEGGDRAVSRADVLAQVQGVRKRGYAFSRHAYLKGVGMIAMPVASADGRMRYAIGVGGPVDRLNEKEQAIVRELRAAVRGLSRARKAV